MALLPIISGALGVAAQIGSAFVGNKAQQDALDAQRRAVDSMKILGPGEAEKFKFEGDVEHYRKNLELFRKEHPELAQALAQTELNLAEQASQADPLARAEGILAQRVEEAKVIDPEADAIRRELLRQTRRNLELGARLPPEFQGELVRAGLEDASATGIGGNRLGPVAQRLGTRLGSAGLALEAQRREEATRALSIEDQLARSRSSILGDLVSQSAMLPTQRAVVTSQLRGAVGGEVPAFGLTGADLLQLEMQRINTMNQQQLARAGIEAQKAQSQGQFLQSAIGAVGSQLPGIAGGVSSMFAPKTGAAAFSNPKF